MNKNTIIAIAALVVIIGAAVMFTGNKGATTNNGQMPGLKNQGANASDPMEDVCKYFPKELIQEAIGKPILKVEGPQITGYKNCFYYTIYTEDYDYSPYTGHSPGGAPVVVTYSTDMDELLRDKASNEKTGSKYVKDPSIGMDNYVVSDHGGTIWSVVLFLGQEKYIRMHYVHSAVTGPELLKIGVRLAERIQNGK